MTDKITKATERRDFYARLVLIDPIFVPVFERAEQELSIALAAVDLVAAARAIARRQAA